MVVLDKRVRVLDYKKDLVLRRNVGACVIEYKITKVILITKYLCRMMMQNSNFL